jgi:GT2 family glycosyltransferase
MNRTVTIIIPIYNAYEDTKQCIESVLEYTDKKHSLLLVNDASSDIRISKLTGNFALKHTHIKVLQNQENLGFVKTCNRAFSESTQETDVILLNSDTIVTPKWLEKLTSAAYSSPYIATVTPLTNNGTVCSVPIWLEYNDIPEGQNILSFAKLIEKVSLRKYPRIPTAVGFCMYIKRKVLDEVGYFDAVNFGRGYGEENDFCCRASKKGYFHIIDDATFVYHAGSKSFKEEKQKLIKENSKVLAKLHPRYFPEVHYLIQAHPFKDILDNLELHLKIDNFKKLSPICFILHNSIDEPINHPLGGTEYHCAALISNISKQRPVYTLYFNQYSKSIEFDIFYQQEKINFEFSYNFQEQYLQKYFHHEANFLRLLVGILQYFQPTLIHIHHLIGLQLADANAALKKLDIPYILSLHDYYLICPSYNLIDYQENFCFENKTIENCKVCIQKIFNQGEELKLQWSALCQNLIADANLIIAPSKTAISYFEREYPQLNIHEKSKVIRHGIVNQVNMNKVNQLMDAREINNKQNTNKSHQTLKIALVGSINIAKGAKIFSDLIDIISQKQELVNSFTFEIIGRFNLTLPPHIKNVKMHNAYNREELGILLKDIDVAIFPNIWAETYCLTIDEVLSNGVPVIATSVNAASDRIKEYDAGWVCNSTSANDFLDTLIYLHKNPSELAKVRANLQNYPIVSYEEMAQNYLNEYAKISNRKINYDVEIEITPQEITQAYLWKSNQKVCIPKDELLELKKLQTMISAMEIVSKDELAELKKLQTMISAMETSKLWKLRIYWLRLKKTMGFNINDWWMRERGNE